MKERKVEGAINAQVRKNNIKMGALEGYMREC